MKNEVTKIIGTELKIARIEAGLSINKVMKETGISSCTLCNYEQGKRLMFLDKVMILLNYYGIKPNIFFERVVAKMERK